MSVSSSQPKGESDDQATVVVVDDDVEVREALANLLRSVGLDVALFASAAEFLRTGVPDGPACLVLDIRLPGVSGFDFQTQLMKLGVHMPIIFMTGHGDIPMSVRAMKAGAVDFLAKPFRDQDMLDAVTSGLELDRERRAARQTSEGLRDRHDALTPKEAQVMRYVTKGLLNKQIANEMGLADITVKVHRSNVMRKMNARSLADLVRMADQLGLHGE